MLQTKVNMKNNDKHKRAFLIWLAIYPLITALFFLTGDLLMLLPLVARTFVVTVVAVPIVFYVLLPWYHKMFRQWLNQNK